MTDPIRDALDRLQEYAAAHPEHDTDEILRCALKRLVEPVDAPAAVAEEWNHASWDDLAELFNRHCCEVGDEGVGIVAKDVPAFARAVLARLGQPPAPPAEGEVAELVAFLKQESEELDYQFEHGPSMKMRRAAELLKRHTAPVPVPVSERLPAAGEWVWHCYAEVRFWEHGRYNGRQFFIGDGPESQPVTHWLPAHALPLPAPQGEEVEP